MFRPSTWIILFCLLLSITACSPAAEEATTEAPSTSPPETAVTQTTTPTTTVASSAANVDDEIAIILEATLVGDIEAGKQIYLGEGGCIICHTFTGVPGANGQIGTDHTQLSSQAAELAYHTGLASPEDFVRQSIVDPNAHISKACPNGPCSSNVMPQNFGTRLTEQQIDDLVAFLLYWQPTVSDGSAQATGRGSSINDEGEIILPPIEPLELSGDILVTGSTTLFPLTATLIDRFHQDGFVGIIKNAGIGTGEGFEYFCDVGQSDISTASRPMTNAEFESCQENGREPIELTVGIDALAVVVNADNTFVNNLTLLELITVLTAATWDEVNPNWPNDPIVHYLPDPDSATFNFIADAVFNGDASALLNAPNTTFFDNPTVLAESVATEPVAIGLVSYSFYQRNTDQLKLLAIEEAEPTVEAVRSDGYLFTRPLFMYVDAQAIQDKPQVSGFVNYYLTHVNKEIAQAGYFPASGKDLDEAKVGLLQALGNNSYLAALGLFSAETADTTRANNFLAAAGLPPADGPAIMDYILNENPYQTWNTWPADDWNDFSSFLISGAPHGNVVRIFVNDIALDAAAKANFEGILPPGSLIIKENFSNQNLTNPGPLDQLTLMYKVPGFNPDSNDWYWLNGKDETDITNAGVGASCLACHSRLNNHDYMLRYAFGDEPAVPSIGSSADVQVSNDNSDSDATVEITPSILNSFAPLPDEAPAPDYELTDEIVDLGRMLFYEPRMSANHEVSCNTCHLLDQYGVDGLPVSIGVDDAVGERNSPTVYNAALHFAQFWDGRAANVEEQSLAPFTNPIEMGLPEPEYAEAVLRSIPEYVDLFATAFPDEDDPIYLENIAIAIGAFERGLLTPSRFDQFLKGDETALTEVEKRGLATFVETGCHICHNGSTIGGTLFQKFGLADSYEIEDTGRYELTGNESDKFVFKVPSLRNITETAPYLQDGSVETLEEMVDIMAEYQLGVDLTDAQIADIIAFLGSLTGEIPTDYIAPPELPENGPDTPAPIR